MVLPAGYQRKLINVPPNFNAFLNFQQITKSVEQVVVAHTLPDAMRRAFTQVRNGLPRPVMVEIPLDLFAEDIAEPLVYRPVPQLRSAPDPQAIDEVARILVEARRPVIYAGQGVHYAQAWQPLRELAEQLEAPVTTSLQGKSAFPETHPLALGSGGRAIHGAVHQFLTAADVLFGIGCSFTITNYGVRIPAGKVVIQATLDPADLNKDYPIDYGLHGDAKLTILALAEAVRERLSGKSRGRSASIAEAIRASKEQWLSEWMPRLTSNEKPLSPYRVIWDMLHTVDVAATIITHDAGSPSDQLSPFWQTQEGTPALLEFITQKELAVSTFK